MHCWVGRGRAVPELALKLPCTWMAAWLVHGGRALPRTQARLLAEG